MEVFFTTAQLLLLHASNSNIIRIKENTKLFTLKHPNKNLISKKKEEKKSSRKEAKVADLLEHPLDGANLVLQGHGLDLPLHPRPLGAAAAAHRPAHRHPPPPVTAVGHSSPPPDSGIRKDLGQGVARKLKPDRESWRTKEGKNNIKI